jgi:hypothetical protein
MYIPKNRLITDLKTNQGEFVYKGTNTPYNGVYWKSYDGKYFTGKNPNDFPSIEIIPQINTDVPINTPSLTIAPFYTNIINNNEDDFLEFIINSEIDLISEYIPLKNIDIATVKLLPSQYYPTPTQDDYNLGVFTRYFVVKANENVYLEVNKDTYNNILNQNPNWAWELYVPFTILWTLTGERDNVFITNRNITQLTEQRLKRRGLQEFLKQNYLKFYQTNEQNIS